MQRHKRFPWGRLIILIIGLLFLALGAAFWFLSNSHIIDSNWSTILSIIFGVLGVTLTFIFWLFPIPTNQSETGAFKDTSTSSHSPHLSLQQAQQAQQIGNVQSLQQIFLSQGFPVSPQSPLTGKATPLASASTAQSADVKNKQQQDSVVPVNVEAIEERQPLSDPDAVFHFNAYLTNSREFYGRARQRVTLISRSRRGLSTSIVGERRIGKTWLIRYLMLITPTKLGPHYQVGYLDVTRPSCSTVAGFTTEALRELGFPTLTRHTNLELDILEEYVKELTSKNRIPILCIDEFEGFSNQQTFDLSFFAGLRAITQVGLSLIVASKRPLIDIVSDQIKTSPFFNVCEQLTLEPFNLKEAEEFVKIKGDQVGFTEQERKYLLKYGKQGEQQWSPLRPQLVGKMLQEDKNLAAKEGSYYYCPEDLDYWWEFEKRLEETFRGAVS